MVNVPPLLCSTPPPIDFGEEDEDLDVIPPTLDGVDDEDFGDFITEDNSRNNEPLPSPRSSSVSILPPVSIYDSLIPPEEDPPNNLVPPELEENKSKNKNNNIANIAEAFNYNIKNTNEEANNKTEEDSKDTSIETALTGKLDTKEQKVMENFCKNQSGINNESAISENRQEVREPNEAKNIKMNPKELRIETFNLENKCNSNKTSLSSIHNVVSIEDIEDDLSDDELYSPKTPKNFTETDNMQEYFIIREITDDTIKENQTTSKSVLKEADTKSVDSLDNNELSRVENENEYKSCSSNSFHQNTFDMPPPSDYQSSSIDDNDEDDFGDFADFQDFNTAMTTEIQANVDNSVPVNDIINKQLKLDNGDLEVNDFNDFSNHNSRIEFRDSDSKKIYEINEIISTDLNGFKQPEEFKDSIDDDEFDDFSSDTDKFKIKTDDIKEFKPNSLQNYKTENNELVELSEIVINHKINSSIPQDNLNDSIGEFNDAPDINNKLQIKAGTLNVEATLKDINQTPSLTEHSSKVGDIFGDFSEASKIEVFSNKQHELKIEISRQENPSDFEKPTENMNDDDFNDFADFEHQEIPKIEQKQLGEIKETVIPPNPSNDGIDFDNDDDDDDDDFGDFNTAEPITPTASACAPLTTSQNIYTTATPMLTPKNLNERISKILQLMFNPHVSNVVEKNTAEPNANKIQEIPFTSIDAAKALEYQWLNSDTRHSFIKSLGIDSKNILYGENWNPSLPRFAANLSFNPLKPMKPVLSPGNMADSCSILEPVSINTSELKKSSPMDSSNSIKKEKIDIDWKSTNMTDQQKEAFKDNKLTSEVQSTSATTSSLPYISNEVPTDPVSLTMFEKTLENEDTFSKTPPISEMESVTTFSSHLPTATLEIELPTTQIINNLNDFKLKEVEENLKNTLNINEVVATSTFTGSFKETHIYTPSKTNESETKQTAVSFSSSPLKSIPIDFDYEKAAMGVIINETVVKKEYRDVEYNPPFSMEALNSKSSTNKSEILLSNSNNICGNDNNKMSVGSPIEEDESNDDFTEFQSVPSDIPPPQSIPVTAASNYKPNQYSNKKAAEVAKPAATVSHGGMILSPAILIPQAIFMENNKPKIEWGDSTANINAEELARIEELFPEPKSVKSSNTSNSSQKSTPTHQQASTPSISATVANKELGSRGGGGSSSNNDDDDWSDFVSVPIANNTSTNRSGANNNILVKSPAGSPFKHRSPVVPHRMATTVHTNNSNNDDEWSDFVSSAPQPTAAQQSSSYRVPQFNSGAWQNANFYNNPLSMYHKGPVNINSTAAVVAQQSPKHMYNNNNNYNYNIPQQQQYQTANNIPPVGHYKPTPQQIHIMQNFSTAPVPTPERLTVAAAATTFTARNNQFQVGSAKVAPSIALIPDLGFVAPAIPTHTSFINSLPKPSINTKK